MRTQATQTEPLNELYPSQQSQHQFTLLDSGLARTEYVLSGELSVGACPCPDSSASDHDQKRRAVSQTNVFGANYHHQVILPTSDRIEHNPAIQPGSGASASVVVVLDQHRFVIRTIPSYLNLSPRASYHRLANIKTAATKQVTSDYQQWSVPASALVDNGKDEAILVCCLPQGGQWKSNAIINPKGKPQTSFGAEQSSSPTVPTKTKPLLPTKPEKLRPHNYTNKAFQSQSTTQYAEQLSKRIIDAMIEESSLRTMTKSKSDYTIFDTNPAGVGSVYYQLADDTLPPPPPPLNSCGRSNTTEVFHLDWNESGTNLNAHSSNQYTSTSGMNEILFGLANDYTHTPLPPPPPQLEIGFLEHRSFSESELYLQLKDNCNSSQNIKSILAKELTRRHSAIADLAVEQQSTELAISDSVLDEMVFETIATPPPGFEDVDASELIATGLPHTSQSPYGEESAILERLRSQSMNSQANNSINNTATAGSRSISGQHSILSPESELSTSQVTSVTNCSELLQTTGTTFSSDATGSSGMPALQMECLVGGSGESSAGPGTSLLGVNLAASTSGTSSSGNFHHSPQMLHGGRLMLGRYHLDFDDDDDEEEDDDVYEDNSDCGPNRITGLYQNADFAVAEGSSQDEEEKAKYEFEFETEEEELDDIEAEMPVEYRSRSDLCRPMNLMPANESSSSRPKRPNELEFGVRNGRRYGHRTGSIKNHETRDLDLDALPPPPPLEYLSSSVNRGGHGTSKSLPENLYRSADDKEMEDELMITGSNRARLSRTKSSTIGRNRSKRNRSNMDPADATQTSHYYSQGQQSTSKMGDTFRYPQRYEADNRDLTPVQDICSSDPSTAIDLSTANTVIEKQGDDEVDDYEHEDMFKPDRADADIDENLNYIHDDDTAAKGDNSFSENAMTSETFSERQPKQRFSVEIFDQLNISAEKYAIEHGSMSNSHNNATGTATITRSQSSGSSSLMMLQRQDTFDDTFDVCSTTMSRREDIPLLLSSGSYDNSGPIGAPKSNAETSENIANNEHTTGPTNTLYMMASNSLRESLLRQLPLSDNESSSQPCQHCRTKMEDKDLMDKNKIISKKNKKQKKKLKEHKTDVKQKSKYKNSPKESTARQPSDQDTKKPVRSKYDQNNQHRKLSPPSKQLTSSNSDKSSSTSDDSSSESETLSGDAFPDDSTTSGSFMLDDASPYTESYYGVPFVVDSKQTVRTMSRSFQSVGNNLNRKCRTSPSSASKTSDSGSREEPNHTRGIASSARSLPSNMDRMVVVRQVMDGPGANSLRVRFEQRRKMASQQKPSDCKPSGNSYEDEFGKLATTNTITTGSSTTNTVAKTLTTDLDEDEQLYDNDHTINGSTGIEDEDESVTNNFFGKYQQMLDSHPIDSNIDDQQHRHMIYTGPTIPNLAQYLRSQQPNPLVASGSVRNHQQHNQMSPWNPNGTLNQAQFNSPNNPLSGNVAQSNHQLPQPLPQQPSHQQQQQQQPPQQFCATNDLFEQNSQATERDVERSEFSLQHQNSELEEDESLTFENLNNQSLSVIDEDSKGGPGGSHNNNVDDDAINRKTNDSDHRSIPIMSRFDSKDYDERFSNIEERDLSLEAVLREESKELERVRARRAMTTVVTVDVERHNVDLTEMSSSVDHLHSHQQNATLLEEPSTTLQQIIDDRDDDSSRDILSVPGGHGHRKGNNEDEDEEERTELRDERVALLPCGNDSSDYTHSTLSALNNQQKFTRKLHEIQRLMLEKQDEWNGKDSQACRSDGAQPKQSPQLGDENTNMTSGNANVATGIDAEPGVVTEEITMTFSSTCTGSHNGSANNNTNNTFSECSSSMTMGEIDKSVPLDPIPILKHDHSHHNRSGHGYHHHGKHHHGGHQHHHHHHHHHHSQHRSAHQQRGSSQPPSLLNTGSKGAVMFVDHCPPSDTSSVSANMAQYCARCYHRHKQHPNYHHHHHHHSQQHLQQPQQQAHQSQRHSSHRHHQADTTACYTPTGHRHSRSKSPKVMLPDCVQCMRQHYHRQHYCTTDNSRSEQSNNVSSSGRTGGQDNMILEQARARSLTRNMISGGVGTSTALVTAQTEDINTSEEATLTSDVSGDITPTGTRGGTDLYGTHFQQQPPQRQVSPGNTIERQRSPCNQHHFMCSYCGESTMPPNLVPVTATSQSRFKRRGMPTLARKSFTVEDVYFDVDDEENDIGVHTESYRSSLWIYIGRKEELHVWGNRNRTSNKDRNEHARRSGECVTSGSNTDTTTNSVSTNRSESEESTVSEKCFRKNYESVTHRLIHRKASIELYRRILDQSFAIDKCLTLTRDNNEFGFRIHGSRPVVVSAIEKGTSAEHKGLEVGDIIVSVNSVNVLEASHSEVVKLAHTGSNRLTLELASTASSFQCESNTGKETEHKIIINGYLKRFVEKLAEQCGGNKDKMTNTILWRRRWFVLKSDACLYWYRNPKSVEPIGAISLQGYCAGIVNECLFGQEHLFRLVGYGQTPVKYFAAIDHDTALQWVKALNQNSVRFSNSDEFIETTLHNIHRNPLNFVQPDCYGFLFKFNQLQKSWKQRYFVLKDACLYFYADANSNTALGLFYLHGYKVQACSMLGKKNTFEIVPHNSKFRHIWLCADSDADKKRWLAALEYSIDRWIRLK